MGNAIDNFRVNIKRNLQDCAIQAETPHIDTPQEKSCARMVLINTKNNLMHWEFEIDILNDFFNMSERFDSKKLLEQVEQSLAALSSKETKSGNLFVHDISAEIFISPLAPNEMGVFTIYQGGGRGYRGGTLAVGPLLNEMIHITFEEWRDMTAPLTWNPLNCPQEEREMLGEVVARFEQIAGAKGGTLNDEMGLPGNAVLAPTCKEGPRTRKCESEPDDLRRGQQDCSDEVNTLRQVFSALEVWGLLHYHFFNGEVADTEIDGTTYAHHGLMIREKDQPQNVWVVDSWPYNNGQPPDILPACDWEHKYRWELQYATFHFCNNKD